MTAQEIASFAAQLARGCKHHDYPAGSIAAQYAECPAAQARAAQWVHDWRQAGAYALAKAVSRALR